MTRQTQVSVCRLYNVLVSIMYNSGDPHCALQHLRSCVTVTWLTLYNVGPLLNWHNFIHFFCHVTSAQNKWAVCNSNNTDSKYKNNEKLMEMQKLVPIHFQMCLHLLKTQVTYVYAFRVILPQSLLKMHCVCNTLTLSKTVMKGTVRITIVVGTK